MSYKVVRKANGDIICFGPNTDQYQPGIPQWAVLTIEPSIPSKILGEVTAEKLAQIEASRKRAIDTLPPVTIAGKQYPANSEYREIVSNLARRSGAGRPVPPSLRGADGTVVTLTAALLSQLDDAISAAVQAQWDKYWQKFDAVQAATTEAQVNAVVW